MVVLQIEMLQDSVWGKIIFFFFFFFFVLAKAPNKPIQVVYVPSHLFHMLFELFKVGCAY